MAQPSRIEGDIEFPGNVAFTGAVNLSDQLAVFDEDNLTAAAKLPHTKLQHRMSINHTVASTEAVSTDKRVIHIAYRPERVLSVRAALWSVPDTTGTVVTVDVLKTTGYPVAPSTGTSILSTPVTLRSTDVARYPRSASLAATATLDLGDMLVRKVTYASTAGSLGAGLASEVVLFQHPANST